MPHSKSPFLAQVSALLRAKHYSLRTEEAYVGWIKRFILFHGKQHPETLGEAQAERLTFFQRMATVIDRRYRSWGVAASAPVTCSLWLQFF